MTDDNGTIYALLDRAAGGAVGDPPIADIVAAGRRRRHDRRALQVGALVAAVALVVAGAFAIAGHTSAASPKPAAPVTAKPIPGPTAQQLAAGHWIAMPPAPVHFCTPQAVWDGHDLVVFEGPFNKCPAVAATYDPKANSWTKITPPPAAVGVDPAAAWGGGRLVLVNRTTGIAKAWLPTTGAWQSLDTFPASGLSSMVWTGRSMLGVTSGGGGVPASQQPPPQSFDLAGNSWTPRPSLPQPLKGSGVSLAVSNGQVFAAAGVLIVEHRGNGTSETGYAELLVRSATGWTVAVSSRTSGLPASQQVMTAVRGGIVATGSTCPPAIPCSLEDAVAVFIRTTGSSRSVVALKPVGAGSAGRVPYPYDVAAGAQAVVLSYPSGKDSLGGAALSGPRPGATVMYDVASSRWLSGPTMPSSQESVGTYWTPYGVVSLGSAVGAGAGWLLRPGS